MANRYRLSDLKDMCRDLLAGGGVDPGDAAVVADNLLAANRRGVDSHGVIRMPLYLARLDSGLIAKKTEPKVVRESLATAVVDGQNGWGAVTSRFAMGLAIEKAAKAGVGMVGVRGSNHFGIAAYYGMMPLERDMIGISLTNASATMAAWGGRDAYFGTNPICICVPAGKERPVVYDGATSVVAKGKIMVAQKKGVPIPPTWAMDKEGVPTTDANVAINGVLLPFGTYKGSGLAMAVEVLAGVLPGAAVTLEVGHLYATKSVGDVGHFFAAIDVAAFEDVVKFKTRMDRMIREVRAQRHAQGIDRIYVPGEIEFEKEQATEGNGVEVADETIREIEKFAAKYGVKMPEPIGA